MAVSRGPSRAWGWLGFWLQIAIGAIPIGIPVTIALLTATAPNKKGRSSGKQPAPFMPVELGVPEASWVCWGASAAETTALNDTSHQSKLD